jgi:DNA polymerase-3 subunit delta
MKLTAGRIDGFLARPDPAVRAALIYGPDGGLVRERAERLVAAVAGSLRDPFLVAELSAADVAKTPSLLWDEAAALSMAGGRRVVRVRDAADTLAAALQAVIDESPADALIVVEAGELPARSGLRKLCEASKAAAAIPCYLPDADSIAALARDMLGEAGISLTADAERYLAERLTADRQLARRELEKLIAYAGAGGAVDLDSAAACVGDSAERSLDDLVFAMADGDLAGADAALARLAAAGTSFVAVLRAVQRHVVRLHQAAAAIEAGASAEESMSRLRPPVFFKQQPSFRRQLGYWRRPALDRAAARLLEAEIACKSTGQPAELIAAAAVLELAGYAAQRRSRAGAAGVRGARR